MQNNQVTRGKPTYTQNVIQMMVCHSRLGRVAVDWPSVVCVTLCMAHDYLSDARVHLNCYAQSKGESRCDSNKDLKNTDITRKAHTIENKKH